MRFDDKNNKQRAKKIMIGELSGVTVPAVTGSNATLRKYAADAPREEFITLAKATFTEVLAERENVEAAREILRPTLDQLNRAECALWSANNEAMEEGDTEQVKQNIREYAMLLLTMNKARSKNPDDFAYVPDPEKPSTWKLEIDTPGRISAAAAALSPEGFRGNPVQIPDADRPAVVARVRAAWLKAYPGKDLPDSLKKAGEDDMSKDLEKLQALASMNDVQKAHFEGLSETDQAAFIKMSPEERQVTVDLLKSVDETYVTTDGVTLVKSKTPQYDMLKAMDQRLVKMQERQDTEAFIKVAESEDYKYLPGEPLAKARMLKTVEGLDEVTRKTLTEALKAGNTAMSASFKQQAHGHSNMAKASDKLDGLAKAYAAEHKVTFAKAYEAVMNTAEGQALYNQIGAE